MGAGEDQVTVVCNVACDAGGVATELVTPPVCDVEVSAHAPRIAETASVHPSNTCLNDSCKDVANRTRIEIVSTKILKSVSRANLRSTTCL